MMSCLVNPIINMKFRMIYPTQFWKNRGWCWVYHIFDHRFQLRLATARLGSAPVLHVNWWLLHRFKAGWLEDQPVVDHVYTRLSMRNASHIISYHIISIYVHMIPCLHKYIYILYLICTYTLMYVCVYIYISYLDIYVDMYIYTHIIFMYIYIHTYIYIYICIYTSIYIHT